MSIYPGGKYPVAIVGHEDADNTKPLFDVGVNSSGELMVNAPGSGSNISGTYSPEVVDGCGDGVPITRVLKFDNTTGDPLLPYIWLDPITGATVSAPVEFHSGLGGTGTFTGTIAPSVSATPINKSGTITTGGVAQTLSAANASRHGFWIKNNSIGDLWINELGTASAVQPSLKLGAGDLYEFVAAGVGAISIFGATTGQAFTAREY